MSGQVSAANNGWAIASLLIGVVSLVLTLMGVAFGVIGGIVALLAGLDGIGKARKLGGQGLGFAIAGTAMGAVIVALMAVALLQ